MCRILISDLEAMEMKSKKDKVIKDPEAPKRPSSSFLLFAQEERGKILKDMGPISAGEMGKELGRRWSSLEEGVKEGFKQMADEDRLRYKKEMKTYKQSELFLQKKVSQCKKKKDDAQTGSLDAYFQFLSSQWRIVSAAHPGVSAVHVQDLVWQKWSKGKLGMTEERLNKGKETKTQKMLISERGVRDSPWMVEEGESVEERDTFEQGEFGREM